MTPTWKLWSFCLSIWQMYSWTEKKNIENSHKVGQQYKISSECWKIKQTGIF